MIGQNRKLGVVTLLIATIGLVACGDDDGGSGDTAGAGGSSTAGGSAVRFGAGRGGASGSGRGGAGRAAAPRPMTGQMCPMTEPEAGGTCTAARGTCMFGTRVCDCITPDNTWACWEPSDCPTSVPAERSSCGVVGMTCAPTRGSNCTCAAMGWNCGNQYCPAAEPAADGMCEGGTGDCTYGSRKCECTQSRWACWNPATDCPTTPPADRAACTVNGAICMYMGGNCTCNTMSGWRCGPGVMNDADAGI